MNENITGYVLAFVFAICLILVGVVLMNVKATGIDNHVTVVEQKVDAIGEDVRLLKYGQQLLAAQNGQPIVVTVK